MSTTKRKWDEPENGNTKSATDAAAAAAAIAAKIAAQFANGQLGEGAFSTDIDINDVRNRYMLTKGSTQQQVLLILYSQFGAQLILCIHRSTRKPGPRFQRKELGIQTGQGPLKRTLHYTSI